MKDKIYNADDKNYRTWKQYDERYNQKEAWDAKNFPDAKFRYLKDNGCFLVSIAIMLRHFGIEKESDFTKFNPWIFYERAKAQKCISTAANFDPCSIERLYPVEYLGDISYSRENLIQSLKDGCICLLEVAGKNWPIHYIVPYEILKDDISIMDPGSSREYLSQFEKVFTVVRFKKK